MKNSRPKILDKLPLLKAEIQKQIIGQSEVVDHLLIACLAGGHALLEGAPGLAKTLMVQSLAQATDLDFKRIQFTPDLMPSDIIGTEILDVDPESGQRRFKFNKGPLFTNILLADEINRTPPKTQAALLEAMQEKAVTFAGKNYSMAAPFFILATQNPIEQAGTFPLPEAQLDRFLLYIKVGYPTEEEEIRILEMTTGAKNTQIRPVINANELNSCRSLVREVHLNNDILAYISRLVRSTRPSKAAPDFINDWVEWGAGPRAGQAIIMTAKARALLNGCFSVLPADVEAVLLPALRHRILLNFKAEAEGITTDEICLRLLAGLKMPKP